MTQQKTLKQLFFPICFETLFYMMAGMVDTMMLSSVSDNAVGAVGTANTYIGMFIIAFQVISLGMNAVMTQNIGAGRPGVAYQAKQLGMLFNLALGIILALFLFFFSGSLLGVVGVSEALNKPAREYLQIVGGCCFLNALIPVFSGYLRAFGYTKNSLLATMVANIINLVLNAVFLMVFKWGVKGVAFATVISRVINLTILVISAKLLIKAKSDPNRLSGKTIFKQIIKVGFPSALEGIIYNISMTLVIRFLNQMDADGLNVTARSYTVQVSNFSYSVGVALAQANAIMTGWRIGEGKYDECYHSTNKAAVRGIAVAIVLESIIAFTSQWFLVIFTKDPDMISLVTTLLTIDIALEIGRCTNLVYGQALKTSGDAVFPVTLAASLMFLMAVLGTYIFGIKLGLLAIGAYIGLALDECSRAVGMFLRWKKGTWRKKSLVNNN